MSIPAYLSLGSNMGDREGHLREAIAHLGRVGRVLAISCFYETEPVEFTAQDWFLNCAAVLETTQSPSQLMAGLLQLEREMGRQRTAKKGPRTIDIDILLFGDMVIETAELRIPLLRCTNGASCWNLWRKLLRTCGIRC
jgi:2-amino-4-hydroxy-6-hydroxymethyldihydropteridine diphosphokinase